MLIDCVKNVLIRSYSDPYSSRMRENTDQNNSEYGHFSRSHGPFLHALKMFLSVMEDLRCYASD